MGAGVFSDCIFFLKVNSLPSKEKEKLKSTITLNGGKISFVLSKKCTHAVVGDPAALDRDQQKKIEKHAISVVNPDFIWKLVQEEQVIEKEHKDYEKSHEATVHKDQDDKKNLFLAKFHKNKTQERNREEDLELEDSEYDDNTSHDTVVAKYCCFQKEEEYAVVELLYFTGQCPFPYRISTVYGLPSTSEKKLAFYLVDMVEKACETYDHQINDIKDKGFTQINRIPLQAESLASKALQKVLLQEAIDITRLSPEVAGLVDSMWADLVGYLDSILSCPVENISLNDISKAEGVLLLIQKALTNKDKEATCEMMQEFYRVIPHKEKIENNINMKFLMAKQDLCQVIRDMINVNENNSSIYTSSSTAKYKALRCTIEHIDPNSAEFLQVKQSILDHNRSNRQINILRVFGVERQSEATYFKSDVGNVKSLLHASSPCNFVGILSRGLMLPNLIVIEEFKKGEKTDIGNLGRGIYFRDSISTSIKYSQPSSVTGSRLLMVCDVALGNCADVFRRDYTITEPPNGFHSVHGVRRKDGVKSDFSDDEYVVYDVNQVQMRYIVQFSTDQDCVDLHKESLWISVDQTPDQYMIQPEPSEDVSLDLLDHEIPRGGLIGSDGQQIPLQSIHVKARVMDLFGKVVMFQTYKNESSFPIEAKYVFPLDNKTAVWEFNALVSEEHILGEVPHMDLWNQDAPDVFTVNIGYLPPKATVIIKLTYVSELCSSKLYYNSESVIFSIPENVARWQQDEALQENPQDDGAEADNESNTATGVSFSLDMSIEMPGKIRYIFCETQKIKIKVNECKAVVQTHESSYFNDKGFSIEIRIEMENILRMLVEKHPEQDSEASMLIFQYEFDDYNDEIFTIICLDCSNSMEPYFHSAKQVALLALASIDYNHVNIILFGSNYKELFSFPKSFRLGCSDNDKSNMEQFIKEAKPNMGSTEFWKVLQALSLLRPKVNRQRVLLISDGHVQNENLVIQTLNENRIYIHLFTCGVGTTANKHLLRCLAHDGSGSFDYFADKSKWKWSEQMKNQIKRLKSPVCTAVSARWTQDKENCTEILQAPATIPAAFYEDRILIYGFVPHCTEVTIKALFENEEIENVVSTAGLQKTTGTILHTLTARALIRDYEEGILHKKENENEVKKREMEPFIIQLNKEYSPVIKFTSFVTEKRSEEDDIDVEPNVLEMISEEDVDILPDINWLIPIDEYPWSHHMYFLKCVHFKKENNDPSLSKKKKKTISRAADELVQVNTAPSDLLGLENDDRSERIHLAPPSWSSLSSLQSPEGYWQLSPELGTLLHINVRYLTDEFLVNKGIRSLGLRGIDTIHKLIATLLVLQIVRVHNILSGIRFNTLKLDRSVPKSLQHYRSIGAATEWAGRADQQYPGICMRLGLGKDWDQATLHLLGLDPVATTSDLYSVSHSLFLV
ncbi:protein mono-ADP-ribosyltransferase PARP4-like isoform X2 [Dendropsophus ebraccatus]|uniref:protein mono-ADP-ribosyltransferase PARP4-like isoform X2 n=1 Tax=Dendropsophus ebraccatus TaxID=150705 RepID=UPI0038311D8A